MIEQMKHAPIKKGAEKLQAELAKAWRDIETLPIVELAARNKGVAEYCQHWECRAIKAEEQLAAAQADNARLRDEMSNLLRVYRNAVKLYDPNTDDGYTIRAHKALSQPHSDQALREWGRGFCARFLK